MCRWRSDDNGYCFLHIHQNLILKTNIKQSFSQSTRKTNNETIDCQSKKKASLNAVLKGPALFRTSTAYFTLKTNPLIYTFSATNRFKVNSNFLSAKKPEKWAICTTSFYYWDQNSFRFFFHI